jgi:hypothetical protein
MLKEIDFLDILSKIRYPNFDYVLEYDLNLSPQQNPYSFQSLKQYPYLVIECDGVDNITGKPWKWRSRKWKLSEHMVPTEVVQTAFKATLVALEHEARELFTYKNVPVFDSHIDIEKLVELRKNADCLSVR